MDADLDPRLRPVPSAVAALSQATREEDDRHHHLAHTLRYPAVEVTTQSYTSAHPNTVSPHIPQTGGLVESDNNDDGAPDAFGDHKRPRSCEKCRELKVKCEFEASAIDGRCKRCTKANRACIVTQPARKRQKRDPDANSNRVLELERKVDALTATLRAQVEAGTIQPVQLPPSHNDSITRQTTTVEPTASPSQSVHLPISKAVPPTNASILPSTETVQNQDATPQRQYPSPSSAAGQTSQKRKSGDDSIKSLPKTSFLINNNARGNRSNASSRAADKFSYMHEYVDVVEREEVSAEVADDLFNCYVAEMAIHMPAVVFPPEMTATQVRKEKPTLFLAVLCAAACAKRPKLYDPLMEELLHIYAQRIMVVGEKSLELVQALLVTTLWYNPPERFEAIKFYQFIHIAAVMALDMGMARPPRRPGKKPGTRRSHPIRKTPWPNPEAIDSRRAWVACYFLCCNAAMGLRRPNLIRWTHFLAECVQVLETSPESTPLDKVLADYVRSQHIAEEVGVQFAMDEPMARVTIADPQVQQALRGFELDLQAFAAQAAKNVITPTLTMTTHVINLYMHEVALHVDHNVDEFKPPFTEETLEVTSPEILTQSHIDALATCVQSIKGIFETFLELDVAVVRCLPVAHFVRIAYAAVVLIKMYFASVGPEGKLGQVFNRDDLRVEHYLDGLVKLFSASTADEKARPAAKFLVVLVMLRTWFHRGVEKANPATSTDVADNAGDAGVPTKDTKSGTARDGADTATAYEPSNTRLQLLSEVATGKSSDTRADARAIIPPAPHLVSNFTPEWPSASQQYGYQEHLPEHLQPHVQAVAGYLSANFDATRFTGMDISSAMGDGFEQAMGLAFGYVDVAAYMPSTSHGGDATMHGYQGP